jgi:hypothetical protein
MYLYDNLLNVNVILVLVNLKFFQIFKIPDTNIGIVMQAYYF